MKRGKRWIERDLGGVWWHVRGERMSGNSEVHLSADTFFSLALDPGFHFLPFTPPPPTTPSES